MAISSNATGLRPGVCTSTTRPTTPYTGQIIYETDTGYLRVWDGSAWDYFLPKQDGIPGAYTTHTPTWTNLTIGNGTNDFKYTQVGKFVHLHGKLTFGSTTSVSGHIEMSVPVNAVATTVEPKPGIALQDSGTATYYGFGLFVNAVSRLTLYAYNVAGTYLQATALSATAPHTWANTDVIYIDLVYEAA